MIAGFQPTIVPSSVAKMNLADACVPLPPVIGKVNGDDVLATILKTTPVGVPMFASGFASVGIDTISG